MASVTVELAIADRLLADRIEALLRELDVDVVELGSDAAAISITDRVPQGESDGPVILLADDVDALAALGAGMAGVLPTSASVADLRVALAAASRGLAVAPLRGLGRAPPDAAAPFEEAEAAEASGLTARELEVLALLAEGASNKEIAQKLAISVHTAKFHVASILEKLDATGRTDAVAHALRHGLLML